MVPTQSSFVPSAGRSAISQVQLGDDLVRLAKRRQGPREKIAGAYRARSGRAEESDFPLAGHRDITEHSFHGIHASPGKGKGVTHVSGTICHLCLGPFIAQPRTWRADPHRL